MYTFLTFFFFAYIHSNEFNTYKAATVFLHYFFFFAVITHLFSPFCSWSMDYTNNNWSSSNICRVRNKPTDIKLVKLFLGNLKPSCLNTTVFPALIFTIISLTKKKNKIKKYICCLTF